MIKYIAVFSIVNLIIFILILVFRKSGYKDANRLLALFLFLLAVNQFTLLSWHYNYFVYYSWLVHVDYLSFSMFGYSFYLYITAMTGEKIKLFRHTPFHFLPLLIALIHYLYFHIKYDYEDIMSYIFNAYNHFPFIEYLLNILFSIVTIFYFILSYRKIRKYRKNIKNCLSDIHKINLKWINNLLIIFTTIFIAVAVFLNTLDITVKEQYNETVGITTLAVFYIFFFLKTMQHPSIFSLDVNICPAMLKEGCYGTQCAIKKNNKYISNESIDKYHANLIEYMRTSKAYLNTKLTINDLSEKLNYPVHVISLTINKKTGNNFYSFVNQYRIDEAKKQLLSVHNDILTIEAIGKKCGFNSTACFYEVFKKITGQTPSKFRKENKHTG